jgi:hypothetical protein
MPDIVYEITTGATDLAVGTRTATTMVVTSSSGVDVTLPAASTTEAGLLNAADKTRIDELGTADSPTFAGLTITGLATVDDLHGSFTGDVYLHVRNDDSITLTKGTPVYITGNVGATDRLLVRRANATSLTTMPAIGLMSDALAVGADGAAVVLGKLTGLDTAAYSINTTLYVAEGGGMTATAPTNAQPIAHVCRSSNNSGIVLVLGPGVVS